MCHESWQFRLDICCDSKQTGNPDCRRNVTKRWKRRLKGSPCQPGIVSQLQPASSPTIYRSLCRKDKTRRGKGGEESHKLCKLAPLVLHLNPGLENDTARIFLRVRAVPIQRAAWNRRTYERRISLFATLPRYHTTYYSRVT